MTFIYFVIMIGALVFFHEFGHFAVAKMCDVKVLRFSIGFGPKVLGFTYGETEYVICALPLGGYVLMLGHDFGDLETVDEDEMGRALMAKPIWQRSLVILAGPIANLILPMVIYFAVGLGQTTAPPAHIGEVFVGTPAAAAGLEAGDKIVEIDGVEVQYWHQLLDSVTDAPGQTLELGYERDGKVKRTKITPATKTSTDFLGLNQKTYGQIGVLLGTYGTTIALEGPDTPAQQGGLKPFDRVVTVDGAHVERFHELTSLIRNSEGRPLKMVVMRPKGLDVSFGKFSTFETAEATVTPVKDANDVWSIGVTGADMVLSEVTPDSAAARAGFQVGDRIVELNGEPQSSYSLLTSTIHNAINEALLARPPEDTDAVSVDFEVGYVRDGKRYTAVLTPDVLKFADQAKQDRYKITVGWARTANVIMPEDIPFPFFARASYAAQDAVGETWGYTKMMVRGLARMAQGKVGCDSVGGPILIGELAAKAGEAGAEPFLRMMALISINLAIFNLLPIPILDGGQLSLFAIEAIKRGPLSFRVRQIAAYIGFALIVMIMILAFKNDIERNWDRIVDWVSEE